jgi:hypothetical protein
MHSTGPHQEQTFWTWNWHCFVWNIWLWTKQLSFTDFFIKKRYLHAGTTHKIFILPQLPFSCIYNSFSTGPSGKKNQGFTVLQHLHNCTMIKSSLCSTVINLYTLLKFKKKKGKLQKLMWLRQHYFFLRIIKLEYSIYLYCNNMTLWSKNKITICMTTKPQN